MRPLLALLLLPVVASSVGCVSAPAEWITPGVHQGELIVDGRDRTFELRVPEGKGPFPLVLALHGGGGKATKTARFTGFDALAERERFVLVCPQGVGRQWNDGRRVEGREDVDDVAFLTRLIARLKRHLPIDPARVYVTGISNGAAMLYRLLLEDATAFAAAAPVINALPTALWERGARPAPIPLLILAGDQDPLVPYAGGAIELWGKRRGTVIGFPQTARFFARHNGCGPEPAVERLPDRAPEDGTRVRKEVWSGGAAPVELWTIEGGGHTWPGGTSGFEWLFSGTVGPESEELDAAETIWAFFRRHRR